MRAPLQCDESEHGDHDDKRESGCAFGGPQRRSERKPYGVPRHGMGPSLRAVARRGILAASRRKKRISGTVSAQEWTKRHRDLSAEPALDFGRGIEVPRWKVAWWLGSRRARSSCRTFGKQESELSHPAPVVSRNDVLIPPRRDFGAGPVAKLAHVDHKVWLPSRFCLSRKAVEPRLEVLIGHRGAAFEAFQLAHPVIH